MTVLLIGLRQLMRKRRGNSCDLAAFPMAQDAARAVSRRPDAMPLSDAAHGDGPSIDWITQTASIPQYLCAILRQTAITYLAITKLPFEHPKRMRNDSAQPREYPLPPRRYATLFPVLDRTYL